MSGANRSNVVPRPRTTARQRSRKETFVSAVAWYSMGCRGAVRVSVASTLASASPTIGDDDGVDWEEEEDEDEAVVLVLLVVTVVAEDNDDDE